jgi:site-specific recombinase XerD
VRSIVRIQIAQQRVDAAEGRQPAAAGFLHGPQPATRNPHTRKAYARAAAKFADWCARQGITALQQVQPVHVAAWVETLQLRLAAPSVKQHLAALRMLFDWLVVGQVMPSNPASVVRGPKHSVRKGKTPVLAAEEVGGCSMRSTSPHRWACATARSSA